VPHLPYFALGFLFADLYVLDSYVFRPGGLLWDCVGLTGFAALAAMLVAGVYGGQVPWVLGIVCLAVFKGHALNRLCTLPLVVTGGAMSYTIYLYHYPIVLGVGRTLQLLFGNNASFGTLGAHSMAIVGTTLLISPFLFRLFEQPFMDKDWPFRLFARFGDSRTSAVVSEE
jgi:peptidoglycan/LPS O-acetylase OafA/YrhL